jgi:hypothetical protein
MYLAANPLTRANTSATQRCIGADHLPQILGVELGCAFDRADGRFSSGKTLVRPFAERGVFRGRYDPNIIKADALRGR